MSEERVFAYPEWFDGKKVNDLIFSAKFMKKRQIMVYNSRFVGQEGMIPDELVKAMIAESLFAVFPDDLERRAGTLLKTVRMFGTQNPWVPKPNLIHVKNGTLDITSRRFTHDREICQARLDVMFNPGAEEPTTWLRFLSELLSPEDIPTLQEYMGYCLIPSTRAQKMLIIIGRGGEGKSRIGLVMKALLGEGLCYGSIHKVETNRFAPASLEGKLVMVDDDLNLSALPSTNNLKTIVTAEAPIELERKGVQSHQGLLNCRFLGFGNGMLTSLYDSSDGFYRRQIVLEALPKPADREDDPYLIDRLKEELPGIFLWCIEGLKRLIDANYRFTISERAARRMRVLRTEQDTVQSFLDSSGYIRLTDEGRTASAGLYDCYRRWCQDNSCREVSSSRFTQELKDRAEKVGLRYTNGIPLMKGKRVRGFHGIEVIDQPFGSD